MGFPFRGNDPSDDSQIDNRGSLKRFLGWVTEIDWAGQFTSALTPAPSTPTASEAQAGITQFAAASDVQGATSSVLAVSPLRLAGTRAERTAALSTLGAYATSATVPNGTWLQLSFTPVNGRSDLVANGYLTPVAGFYLVNGFVRWNDGNAPRGIGAAISVNGNRFDDRASWVPWSGQTRASNSVSMIVSAAANSTIGLQAYSDGGDTTINTANLEVIPLRAT